MTSAEAVEAIVSAKQQERLRELERKRLEVAAQHDRELRQAAEEHRAIHDDNQLRKARRGCTRSTLYIVCVSTRLGGGVVEREAQ